MDERERILSMYPDDAVSSIPCNICGGAVIEFSIPNDIWNKVIRLDGHEHDKEYLCMACFFDALRVALGIGVITMKRNWTGFKWENNGGITEILRQPPGQTGMWTYIHYVNGVGVAGGLHSDSFLQHIEAWLKSSDRTRA